MIFMGQRRRRAGYRVECRRTGVGYGGIGLVQTAAVVAAACKDDHVSVLRRVEVATRY